MSDDEVPLPQNREHVMTISRTEYYPSHHIQHRAALRAGVAFLALVIASPALAGGHGISVGVSVGGAHGLSIGTGGLGGTGGGLLGGGVANVGLGSVGVGIGGNGIGAPGFTGGSNFFSGGAN